ncbi:MAG: formate dehydrogenase, partial [Syntrophomonadaceae bacterium]|nr:formate dehydrogenase [Syntrophomonadaceae bacterium]
MANRGERVLRFGRSARVAHWGHTVTFLVLLFTGLALFTPKLGFLASAFYGYATASLIHKYMAVLYTVI